MTSIWANFRIFIHEHHDCVHVNLGSELGVDDWRFHLVQLLEEKCGFSSNHPAIRGGRISEKERQNETSPNNFVPAKVLKNAKSAELLVLPLSQESSIPDIGEKAKPFVYPYTTLSLTRDTANLMDDKFGPLLEFTLSAPTFFDRDYVDNEMMKLVKHLRGEGIYLSDAYIGYLPMKESSSPYYPSDGGKKGQMGIVLTPMTKDFDKFFKPQNWVPGIPLRLRLENGSGTLPISIQNPRFFKCYFHCGPQISSGELILLERLALLERSVETDFVAPSFSSVKRETHDAVPKMEPVSISKQSSVPMVISPTFVMGRRENSATRGGGMSFFQSFFFKSTKPRMFQEHDVENLRYWERMVKSVGSYPVELSETAKIVQIQNHDDFVQHALERKKRYEEKMRRLLEESISKVQDIWDTSVAKDDPQMHLRINDVVTKCCKDVNWLEKQMELAMNDAERKFTPSSVDMIFTFDREDLACRSMVLLLQYAKLIFTDEEHQSREYLTKIVVESPKFVLNKVQSRTYQGHFSRELLIDFICLRCWRKMPGYYSVFKQTLLKKSKSKMLLLLLLLRALRHVALLLESIRFDRFPGINVTLVGSTIAVERFEMSLLWETTNDIPAIKPDKPKSFANLIYEDEMIYANQGNYKLQISEVEKQRIQANKSGYQHFVETHATLINTAKEKIPVSRMAISRWSKGDDDLSQFKELLCLFAKCAEVAKNFQKPVRDTDCENVLELCESLISYIFKEPKTTFELMRTKLVETSDDLLAKLSKELPDEKPESSSNLSIKV